MKDEDVVFEDGCFELRGSEDQESGVPTKNLMFHDSL